MKSSFPLFSSHLDLAHFWWSKLVGPDDLVCDMTAGKGQDTLFLASLNPKRLIAIDVQPQAVASTKALCKEKAEVYLKDHADFPQELEEHSVKLAVYNLGWLPGSDKACKTLSSSTLKSVFSLLPKIAAGGLISITCYPGHPEGKEEEEELLKALSTLDPKAWSLCHHRWLNRRAAPSLLMLLKSHE